MTAADPSIEDLLALSVPVVVAAVVVGMSVPENVLRFLSPRTEMKITRALLGILLSYFAAWVGATIERLRLLRMGVDMSPSADGSIFGQWPLLWVPAAGCLVWASITIARVVAERSIRP